MERIVFIFSMVFLISCHSKTKIIKGDLYFKLVTITSPEGMSNQETEQLKQTLNNFRSDNATDSKEKELFTYLKKLEEQELLGLPFIMIKELNEETKQIFLSKKEYEKIKNFTLSYLNSNHKKVTLELELKSKDNILYSDNIISIQESGGETFSSK